MAGALRLALWKTNGLSSHHLELQTFLDLHKIDIALISETHFTSRTVFRLPRYTVFHTIHTDDTVHGGAAVIIRNSLRHHEQLRIQTKELQAIAVHLEALPWPLTVLHVMLLLLSPTLLFSTPRAHGSWSEATGTRNTPLGAHVSLRLKDALSSLRFMNVIVPTTALANRLTG